jgi:LPXTG-site transpeptidase (sortase) family protein
MGFLKQWVNTPRRRLVAGLGSASVLAAIIGIGLTVYFVTSGDQTVAVADDAAVVDLTEEPIDLDLAPHDGTPFPEILSPTPVPPPPLGDSGYNIVIDKLGVTAPVTMFGMDENLVPEVPYTATDVAWYNFSARPGTRGNAIFAGHVTWNGPAVFYDLDQLAAGDHVKLTGHDGTQVVYQVTDVFQVDPNDPDSRKVMWPTNDDVITIITCSGKFFNTDDPVLGGDYTHRLIVRGDLISVDRPAAAAAAD